MTHLTAERARLDASVQSYGDVVAPFDLRMRTYMMRTLAPFFGEGQCLQVGCAHGDQTSLLLEHYDKVTVVEPVAEFIELTRERLGNRVQFVNSLLEYFETNERYETIIFSHVLEHVLDPAIALRKLGSLLTETGRLYVVVPNAEAPSRRIAVKMGVLLHLEALSPDDVAAGHRRVYRLDTLSGDCRVAGLRIEQTGGIFFKPLANFQFNALIDGPLIGETFMEGCYQLGKERPGECASIYAILGRPDPL